MLASHLKLKLIASRKRKVDPSINKKQKAEAGKVNRKQSTCSSFYSPFSTHLKRVNLNKVPILAESQERVSVTPFKISCFQNEVRTTNFQSNYVLEDIDAFKRNLRQKILMSIQKLKDRCEPLPEVRRSTAKGLRALKIATQQCDPGIKKLHFRLERKTYQKPRSEVRHTQPPPNRRNQLQLSRWKDEEFQKQNFFLSSLDQL